MKIFMFIYFFYNYYSSVCRGYYDFFSVVLE